MKHRTPEDMVREFAKAMGHPLDSNISLSTNLIQLRKALISEEQLEVDREAYHAIREIDVFGSVTTTTRAALLKELADLVYVAYGMAATFGLPLDAALSRVHDSNMSKLGPDGKPIYREDGKVLKGPNYKPCNLEDLV